MIQRSHIIVALSVLAGLAFHATDAAADDRGLNGVVAAEALVADANGKPVWAEFKPDGTSTDICPDPGNLTLISGAAYRAAVAAFDEITVDKRRVLTATEYAAASFVDAAGKPVAKPNLSASTFSVVVRLPEVMRVPSDALILLQSPIDLRNPEPVEDDVLALLMGPCSTCTCGAAAGSAKRIVYQAHAGKIAYKTAYYIDAGTHEAQPNLFNFLRHIDQLLGPVEGVQVDLWTGSRTTPGKTNKEGIYTVLFYDPPFPNCGPIETPVTATVQFDAFNPRTSQPRVFSTTLPAPYLTAVDCTAPAGPEINFKGFQQSVNFGLQVALLAGTAVVKNEARPNIGISNPGDVVVANPTSYDASRATFIPALPPADMDLDGDGQPDKTKLEDGGVKVWLGNSDPERDPPDLVRLPDRKEDLTDRGLLAQISEDDLKATDIYVYRLSTMQLVGARRSANAALPAADWLTNPPPPSTGAVGGKLQFDMLLQGPRGFYAKGNGRYADWAARTLMDDTLIEQPHGNLVVGEPVKLYLINRATGYMGSAIATVVGSTLPGGAPSRLTFHPDEPVIMRPPNLRVKAERTFDPPAQDPREDVLVGYEGAAMTHDDYVKVTTEWLDWDGSALPEDLPGFTGRLAHVVTANVLGTAPGVLGEFEIHPGESVEELELPEKGAETSHFYIHVHPYPSEDNPDFSANAQSNGRPARYVPVLVPIYNETETATAAKLAREAKEEPPAPIYSWVYRPEMQFSMLDLDLKSMTRKTEEGQTVTTVLTEEQQNLLFSSTDQSLDFIYTLLQDELPVLQQFGADRELVLAIGGQEVRATIGPDGQAHFTNLDTITTISADDLLTLRLYENGDDANVLWEYVLEYLAVEDLLIGDPRADVVDNEFHVTPDDNTVDLQATLVGYANRAEKDKDPNFQIDWSVQNGGFALAELSPSTLDLGQGTSKTQLRVMAGKPGDAITVTATLASDPSVKDRFKVIIDGGEPFMFSSTLKLGEVSAAGVGEAEVVVGCVDHWNNPVPDGTSVDMDLVGDAQLEYEAPATPLTPPAGGTADPFSAGGGPGTIHGEVRVKLHAGMTPTSGGVRPQGDANEQAKLTVKAGTLTHEFAFEIHPVTVSLQADWTSGTPLIPATPHTITATVKDWEGNPIPDAVVAFVGTHTIVTTGGTGSSQGKTDAAGKITATFGSGFQPVDEAKLTATVGYAGRGQLTYSVGGTTIPLNVASALLIGDRATNGTVDYTRPDNSVVGLPYQAQADVQVHGAVGSAMDVQIGDLTDPNIQPALALYMYGLGENAQGATTAPDENGLHDGLAEGVDVLEDSIMGASNSYVFRKAHSFTDPSSGATQQFPASRIVVDNTPDLDLGTGIGFRVEVKPDAVGVPVFRKRSGAERLEIDGAGFAVYSIRTGSGPGARSFSIRSQSSLATHQWHAIGGRFKSGVLELVVDGEVAPSVAVTGTLSSGSEGLVIGDGYDGGMKSFNWYDWSLPELVHFDSGGSTKRVTFDATGQATLHLVSAGKLNQQPTGATLRTMRVAASVTTVGAPGTGSSAFLSVTRQFISLVSVAAYLDISSTVVETRAFYSDPSLPPLGPVQFTALDPSVLGHLVPTAHAVTVAEGLWAVVTEVASWWIPYNDAVMLGTQIYKLITGADDFSWLDLTLSAIGVLSFVPVLAPLKPVRFILDKVLHLIEHRTVLKYLAGALRKAVEFLLSKTGQRVLDIVPFMIMIGELAFTPDGQKSVEFMWNSIESGDALWNWIGYLNLPLGGWAENTEPPEVGLTAQDEDDSTTGSPFTPRTMATVPVAHASTATKAARITKTVLKDMLKAAEHELVEVAGQGPRLMSECVGVISKNRSKITGEISKMVHDPQYVKLQIRLLIKKGEERAKQALRDKPSDRISVREMAGISAFIVAMRAAGRVTVDPEDIAVILAKSFVDSDSNRHGARFQMMMMAELAVAAEFTGFKVTGAEVEVPVPFFRNNAQRKPGGIPLATYRRRVDLVTNKGSATEWWEVKSIKAGQETSTDFGGWRMSRATISNSSERGRGKYHREFVADRAAWLARNDNILATNVRAKFPTEVRWAFQKFLTKSEERSLDASAVKTAAKTLCKNPIASRDLIFGAFGKGKDKAEKDCGATRNPIGQVFLDNGEQITADLRDLRSRLFAILDEGLYLPRLSH